MTEADIRLRISNCGHALISAYARYLDSGKQEDRAEAFQWLERQKEAQRELQKCLEQGSAWFGTEEAQAMGRQAA